MRVFLSQNAQIICLPFLFFNRFKKTGGNRKEKKNQTKRHTENVHAKAKIKEEKFLFDKVLERNNFENWVFFSNRKRRFNDLPMNSNGKMGNSYLQFRPFKQYYSLIFFSPTFLCQLSFFVINLRRLKMNKFKFLIVHAFVIALRWVRGW